MHPVVHARTGSDVSFNAGFSHLTGPCVGCGIEPPYIEAINESPGLVHTGLAPPVVEPRRCRATPCVG